MKIVIEKAGVKREIEGPFNICGSPDDLETIVRCIEDADIRGYGWVRITAEIEPFTPNTAPLGWTEKA